MRVVVFHNGSGTAGEPPRSRQSVQAEIEAYCAEHHHRLVELMMPSDGVWSDEQVTEQYELLCQTVNPPDGRPALILIYSAAHMASRLDTFIGRWLNLVEHRSEVRCLNPDLPDPLQNALVTLPLAGKTSSRGKNIRRALLNVATRGAVVGRMPYGYYKKPDGTYGVNTDEAENVRDIFSMYTGSRQMEGAEAGALGLRKIANYLNKNQRWTQNGKPWTPTGILNILNQRAYLGNYSRCSVDIIGNHEQIVDMEEFKLAQQVLRQRKPVRRPNGATDKFLLTGLLYCGGCGAKMIGTKKVRQWQNQDGSFQTKSYRYYECPLRNTDASVHWSLSADVADQRTLKWAEKLGKRAKGKVVDAYQRFATTKLDVQGDTDAKTKRFLSVVEAVSEAQGDEWDLKEALDEYRGGMSGEGDSASASGFNGDGAEPAADAAAVVDERPVLNADDLFTRREAIEVRHLNLALREILAGVDVVSAKKLNFRKLSNAPATA